MILGRFFGPNGWQTKPIVAVTDPIELTPDTPGLDTGIDTGVPAGAFPLCILFDVTETFLFQDSSRYFAPIDASDNVMTPTGYGAALDSSGRWVLPLDSAYNGYPLGPEPLKFLVSPPGGPATQGRATARVVYYGGD